MDKTGTIEQNVIAMTDYSPQIGFAAITQVEAYWEALRNGNVVPKRADIDPRGLEGALENAFILERITAGLARLRIAGSHLNDLMGMEVRGMPLTAFFLPDARRQVADLLEQVFQVPAVAQLQLEEQPRAGGAGGAAQMVLLPLRSDLGDVSRILGCFVAKGEGGPGPRRFDILSKTVRPILAEPGHPRPLTAPAQRPKARPPGFAAPASPFKASTEKRRPPYLRLVKSDD